VLRLSEDRGNVAFLLRTESGELFGVYRRNTQEALSAAPLELTLSTDNQGSISLIRKAAASSYAPNGRLLRLAFRLLAILPLLMVAELCPDHRRGSSSHIARRFPQCWRPPRFHSGQLMSTTSRVFVPGETATVEVLRWFAKQEGLIVYIRAAIGAAPFSIVRVRSKRSPCW
jgi:hypothetical protein